MMVAEAFSGISYHPLRSGPAGISGGWHKSLAHLAHLLLTLLRGHLPVSRTLFNFMRL
jgi:hypothetical protein